MFYLYKPTKRHFFGFTMAEFIFVIVLMTILISVISPSMYRIYMRSQLSSFGQQLIYDLNDFRQQSQLSQKRFRVRLIRNTSEFSIDQQSVDFDVWKRCINRSNVSPGINFVSSDFGGDQFVFSEDGVVYQTGLDLPPSSSLSVPINSVKYIVIGNGYALYRIHIYPGLKMIKGEFYSEEE